MDSREKKAIFGSVFLMVLFFGAVVIATTGFGINVPDCITDVKPFAKSALLKIGENHYQLHCIARMWSFDPLEVELPAGSRLDIYLTSADVAHGFLVNKKAVNLMAIPGQVTFTSVVFDKNETGTYSVVCHEYCGTNHHSMEGRIYVRPAEDFVEAATTEESAKPSQPATAGGAQ